MFYEEKVVNGVLCSRGCPDGEWIPITQEVLTARLMRSEGNVSAMTEALEELLDSADVAEAVTAKNGFTTDSRLHRARQNNVVALLARIAAHQSGKA